MASATNVLCLLVSCAFIVDATDSTIAMLSDGTLLKTEHAHKAFNEFVVKHSRDYEHGSEEYDMRRALFQERFAAVQTHNAKPDQRWKAGVSHFSDRTEAERSSVLGYRRGKNLTPRGAGSSLLQMSSTVLDMEHLMHMEEPQEHSWQNLKVATNVRDQGFCGSCWAFTTISVMEAHYEIHHAKGGPTRNFSPQQVVSCTPNPHGCGGSGGCGGATVELGMDWIAKNGLASEEEVPYHASDGKCTLTKHQDGSGTKADLVADKQELTEESTSPAGKGGALVGMLGYHTLPSNEDKPLALAVLNYGPVGVAVAAGAWFEYSSGVFDGCPKDGVLNHAVTLYGFGKEGSEKYWTIRNSYGKNWGEHGFIRLKRYGQGNKHCGKDTDPMEGVMCQGAKESEVKICGQCGILYDAVIPYFEGSPLPHLPNVLYGPQSGIGNTTDDKTEVFKTEDDAALMRTVKRH